MPFHVCSEQLRWDSFSEFLAAVLAFFGNKGLRQRFLELCMPHASAEEKSCAAGMKHNVVDWKWGYMEESLMRLSASLHVLKYLDVPKLKRPVGHAVEDPTVAVNMQCIQTLEKAQKDLDVISCRCEAFAVFSHGVGAVPRWFTGCRCHDYIWTQPITDRAKQKQFEQVAGLKHCVWRGRRASELARGHWRKLLSWIRLRARCGLFCAGGMPVSCMGSVVSFGFLLELAIAFARFHAIALRPRSSDSVELQQRLTKLPVSERANIVSMLDSLKRGTVEELHAKLSYWDELPHILLGVYPNDADARGVAEAALRKWDALSEAERQGSHRITRRFLDPALGQEFPVLFRCFPQ